VPETGHDDEPRSGDAGVQLLRHAQGRALVGVAVQQHRRSLDAREHVPQVGLGNGARHGPGAGGPNLGHDARELFGPVRGQRVGEQSRYRRRRERAGRLLGEPVEVFMGRKTGLPIPAHAEIAFEGFVHPDDLVDEGPLGEWTGYYAGGRKREPAIRIETFWHRNDPVLLGAVPDLAMSGRQRIPVKGEIPNPINPPPGCAFNPRCPLAFELCRKEAPKLINGVACHAVNLAPAPA